MKINVRTKGLDNRKDKSLGYNQVTQVSINNYQSVGTCAIYNDAQGDYYATLDIDDNIDLSMYAYYNNSNPYGTFWFDGLLLRDKILEDRPNVRRLKDMIV